MDYAFYSCEAVKIKGYTKRVSISTGRLILRAPPGVQSRLPLAIPEIAIGAGVAGFIGTIFGIK